MNLVQLHEVLYMNPKGQSRNIASYSSRSKFKHCKRLFKLQYIEGWHPRIDGVSMVFGNVVEAAWMHSTKMGGREGVPIFTELWNKARKEKDFEKRVYRGNEDSFDNLMRCGQEMLRIFELRFESYPLANIKFQVPLRKKIFPNTSYDKIENLAYVDAICEVDPHHPALPKVEWNVNLLRRIIIDVKTSGVLFPEKLISLDPQLIEYAWMDGRAFTLGFLNFVKESHGFKFGSRVTLLEPAGELLAGSDVTVLDKANALEAWVGTPAAAAGYAKACKGADGKDLKGKALDKAAADFLAIAAVKVPNAAFSKQRVQFVAAVIPEEHVHEMGKVIAMTTVEMVVSHEQDFYPMEPGLRYPDKKCTTCEMRSICAGDNEMRDRLLAKTGEEWLDNLVDEES